ncbi:hypothetical protein MASSI9I_50212 [Massilia sp. 9I]|nr:hypothetical protein MASSI9I_50212 [Massilia sp. 9I]
MLVKPREGPQSYVPARERRPTAKAFIHSERKPSDNKGSVRFFFFISPPIQIACSALLPAKTLNTRRQYKVFACPCAVRDVRLHIHRFYRARMASP